MPDLRHRAGELTREFADHAAQVSFSTWFVKALLVVGGTTVIAIAQCATLPLAGGWPVWTIVGMVGTLLAFIGGLFVLFVEPSAARSLRLAQEAIEDAREAEAETADLGFYFDEIRRATELYGATMAMRTAVESLLVGAEGTEESGVQALLDVAERSLRVVLDFQTADHWTLGVYKIVEREGAPRALKCCAQVRSLPCKLEDAREWPEGRGAGWMALASGKEVIIPDLTSPALGTIFDGVLRSSDTVRYRSVAAAPVVLTGPTEKWGAVIATSDQDGHFSLDPAPGVKPLEAVKALSGMIGLSLTARRRTDARRSSVNKGLETVLALATSARVQDAAGKRSA